MIRVRVELVPFGDESNSKEIGQLVLANTGQRLFGECTYEAVLSSDDPVDQQPAIRKSVSHFRKDGFWELLRKILNAPVSTDNLEIFDRLEKRLEYVSKADSEGHGP